MTEPWAASRSIMEGKVPLEGGTARDLKQKFVAWQFQRWLK